MLAKIGTLNDLKRKNYVYEPKIDGTRIIAYINGKNIRLVNRRGIDKLKQYPELKDLPKYINAKSAVLDGELAIYNEKGLPDFNLLQKREHITSKFAID